MVTEEKDLTYVISVRLKLTELAIIGRFMQESGIYSRAKPSGALSAALRLFADSIVANNLGSALDVTEALTIIGMLRYPLEQLDKQLHTQQKSIDRKSLREEALTMLGASARTLAEVRTQVKRSPVSRRQVEDFIAQHAGMEDFSAYEQERLEKDREANLLAIAKAKEQAGIE